MAARRAHDLAIIYMTDFNDASLQQVQLCCTLHPCKCSKSSKSSKCNINTFNTKSSPCHEAITSGLRLRMTRE